LSSVALEALVGASLLDHVLGELGDYRDLIREEVERRLAEIARQLLARLRDSYRSASPHSGWEALERAEKIVEKS
jgi:CBS-domain-containing membrane protein